ncbi:MAG: c-type cytochrome [Acidobacteriota bacterium]
MRKIPSIVWTGGGCLAGYLALRYGIGPLTRLLTGEEEAPLPSSLLWAYMALIAVAILMHMSITDERWQAFVKPVVDFLRDECPPGPLKRLSRAALFAAVPLAAGYQAFSRASKGPDPPADPPGIHFTLPEKYAAIENPYPWTEENIREGGVLYTRNCAPCHGDAQDGEGLFARAFQPKPSNFRDTGTLAQLDENYLYWRIKEGGPGLPKGSIEYRSAMPVWNEVLTDEEIWKIIMFEYTNAGVMPAKRK